MDLAGSNPSLKIRVLLAEVAEDGLNGDNSSRQQSLQVEVEKKKRESYFPSQEKWKIVSPVKGLPSRTKGEEAADMSAGFRLCLIREPGRRNAQSRMHLGRSMARARRQTVASTTLEGQPHQARDRGA